MGQIQPATVDFTTNPRFRFLKTVPLFADLHDSTLGHLVRLMHEEKFDVGAKILVEGDYGDSVYTLYDGEAEVFVSNRENTARVAVLVPPDVFGDMALFENEPRSATVIAKERCRALVLKRKDFVELVAQHPEVLWKLCAVFARRVRAVSKLAAA